MVIVPRRCLSCRAVHCRDHRYSEGALPVPRDRHAVGDVQRQLDGRAGVRDPGARPDRFCAEAGRAFVTSVNTHPRGLPLRGFLSHHGTKTTWAMAFPRNNCRTTTATVLIATATVTLSLRACLFLCYTPITSPSD